MKTFGQSLGSHNKSEVADFSWPSLKLFLFFKILHFLWAMMGKVDLANGETQF